MHTNHLVKLVSYLGIECTSEQPVRLKAAIRKTMNSNQDTKNLVSACLKNLTDFKIRQDHNLKKLKKPDLRDLVEKYELPPKVRTYQKCRMLHAISQHTLKNFDLTKMLTETSESLTDETCSENLDATEYNVLKMCEGCDQEWRRTGAMDTGHYLCVAERFHTQKGAHRL